MLKREKVYNIIYIEHERLLNNTLTSTYKKANNSIKKKIITPGKQILRNKEILNHVEINGEKN